MNITKKVLPKLDLTFYPFLLFSNSTAYESQKLLNNLAQIPNK